MACGSSPGHCATCHGQDPHPIWDSYPIWRGVLGDPHEFINPSKPNFVDAAGIRSNRYRFLDLDRQTRPRPFKDVHAENRPNTEISAALTRPLAIRAARIAKDSPAFATSKYLVLHDLLDCAQDLGSNQRRLAQSKYAQGAQLQIARCEEALVLREKIGYLPMLCSGQPTFSPSWLPTPLDLELGIDLRTLVPSLQDVFPAYSDGSQHAGEVGSFVTQIAAELIQAIAASDPELAEMAKVTDRAFIAYTPEFENRGAICELLRSRLL